MKFFVFSNIERFKALFLVTSSILGFIYYNQIRVDITQTKDKIVIDSKIAQNANLFVKTRYRHLD